MPAPLMLNPLLLGFDLSAWMLEWVCFADRVSRGLDVDEESATVNALALASG